ncbi:MAG: TolC family protein [Sulfurifustis sp.]
MLGFDESLRFAAQRNAALATARANVTAAAQRARAAYGGFYPQVSANVNYSDSTGRLSPTTTFTGTDYSTNVTVTQNLFAGFQDQARVAQAAANVDIADAALVSSKAQLSRDLKVAYAELSYAQDNIVLTESILRRLEENLRLVELRFESGRENKGAYLVTRASVAQARFERLQAQQGLTSAQVQLANLIGQPTTDIEARDVVPTRLPPPAPDFKAIAAQTPDVRDAVARQRSADADVQLARSGFYPSVNVSATRGREGESWFPDNDRRAVNASIAIPLFSGGRDIYSVRGALAALDAAKSNRENVEGLALVRLQQNYAAYVESVEKLNVDREFLDATETRANIARARYQNGLITFDEWDRTENDLIQRQKTFLASQRDRVNAEAAWELAQGQGVIP